MRKSPVTLAATGDAALRVRYLTREQYAEVCQQQLPVLGAVCHGFRCDEITRWPVVETELQPLTSTCVELYLADKLPTYCRNGLFDYALSELHLFGALRQENTAPFLRNEDTQVIYGQLLQFTRSTATPHIARMWNIVPRINMYHNNVEQYQDFCCQRAMAFDDFELHDRALPAASAVGSDGGQINVYFLAGKSRGHAIENSKQVSAYEYPAQYGPRSPSFARARLCEEEGTWRLLVSGTASILGHESRHPGNVAAQTSLALSNIHTLVAEAKQICREDSNRRMSKTLLKVYVRNAEDIAIVSAIIQKSTFSDVSAIYLTADICRRELLVEIELLLEMGNA